MGIGAREKGRQTERATQASRHTPRGIWKVPECRMCCLLLIVL
jgi:hypothetical protein